jgi:hypothetical protein
MYEKPKNKPNKTEYKKGTNRPDSVFQNSGVDLAVWKNTRRTEEGELEVFYKATLNGIYEDKEGRTRYTKGILVDEIPSAIEALTKAYEKYQPIIEKPVEEGGLEKKV